MEKNKIDTIATIHTERDSVPEGDVRTVARIGVENVKSPKQEIILTNEFSARIIVQIDTSDSYPQERNIFYKKLAEAIYGALKGFEYAGYKVKAANVHTDRDLSAPADE